MPRRTVLALVLAALLAGACGGDKTMSTSEYRSKAAKICQDADRATQRIEQPTKSTPAAIADYFSRLLAANDRTTQRFKALDPPDQLRRAHDDALRANDDGIVEVRRVVGDLRAGKDPRAVLQSAQGRLQRLSRRSADAAKRLGVPACGRQ